MIRSFNGKTPQIHPSALISETCFIIGDVEIGEGSSVWPGAVIRGDNAKIKIGRHVHIQDNCVVHTEHGSEICDNVVIGHAVVIHATRIGSTVMVGNNATLLDDCEIGCYTMVGAGSVVPPNVKFPDRSMVIGSPAKRKEEISKKHLEQIEYGLEYYVNAVNLYKSQGF